MITDLNKIIKEWAYRVDDGQPNPNESAHLYHLSEILIEYKWPLQVIDELLQNLNEGDEWWTKLSPEQQAQYIKDHPKSQKAQDAKRKEKGEKPKKDSDDVTGELSDFEKYLSDEQKKAIKLSDKKRVQRLQQLDSMAESFKNLPSEVRNTSSSVFAKGQIYEGRPNSGIGKNRLGYLDVKNLSENKEYLLETYGDGSPEKVKEFVINSRKIRVSENYINSSFELLPKK